MKTTLYIHIGEVITKNMRFKDLSHTIHTNLMVKQYLLYTIFVFNCFYIIRYKSVYDVRASMHQV